MFVRIRDAKLWSELCKAEAITIILSHRCKRFKLYHLASCFVNYL